MSGKIKIITYYDDSGVQRGIFGDVSSQNEKEITEVKDNLLSLLQNYQRKTIQELHSKYFCLKKPGNIFICLSEIGYPERLAYAMLNVISIGI